MSYQPYNSVSVTPINMLNQAPQFGDNEIEYYSHGFSTPKNFQNQKVQTKQFDIQDQVPATSTPVPTPSPPTVDYSCELKHIRYLLMIIVVLLLILLIFKR